MMEAMLADARLRELRAGLLSVTVDGGDLRAVRIGGREVVRRIAVVIRDASWRTVPGQVLAYELREESDSFRISCTIEHRHAEAAFRWRGTIVGSADGVLSFEMDGEVLAPFARNRIGICVLHPNRECAGARCTVTHDDGSREDGAFPSLIAPHQPFRDIRAFAHEVVPGLRAELTFSGEVFEMEDQRNWCDGSFKIYSTPLHLPLPVTVAAGTSVRQAVTLRLIDSGGIAANLIERGEPDTVVVGPLTGRIFPNLGMMLPEASDPLPPCAWDALREIQPAHVRVDLDLRADWRGRLHLGCEHANILFAPLELVIHAEDDAAAFAALATALLEAKPVIGRVLVFDAVKRRTTPAVIARARTHLAAVVGEAIIGGGSDSYFTVLNRQRPEVGSLPLVAYNLQPQGHASDDRSLMENLEAVADQVESARVIAAGSQLAVTPIVLAPRRRDGPQVVDLVDRRASPFAAAWACGCIAELARAGVDSLTIFETIGANGVIAESGSGATYPVHAALVEFAAFAGCNLAQCAAPRGWAAVAALTDNGMRAIVANLRPEARTLRIRGLERPVARGLGGSSALVRAIDGASRLELPPYGVAILDGSAIP
jgi:D-apionolactonase